MIQLVPPGGSTPVWIAGTGIRVPAFTGGSARRTSIRYPRSLAFGPDGSLFVGQDDSVLEAE